MTNTQGRKPSQPRYKAAFQRDAQAAGKEAALLDVAAALFNEKGYAAATLEEVAAALDLTKAAIYYYVPTKEELLFRCYRRACELVADTVAKASAAGGTGLERLLRWVRLQLSGDGPVITVQSELPLLEPDHLKQVHRLNRANLKATRALIEQGLADGSIAPCDPGIANWLITGALAWTPIWRRQDSRPPMKEVAEVFAGLFEKGLSPQRRAPALPETPPHLVLDGPASGFSREAQAQEKKDALTRAATELFNRQGIHGTTLAGIAKSLGVTKGALYFYFDSKEDLLFSCMQRSIKLEDACWKAANAANLDALGVLAANLRFHIETHCGAAGPLASFLDLSLLSEKNQSAIAGAGRRLVRRAARLTARGIEEGSIRKSHATLVEYAITGAINWIPMWHDPAGRLSPREIADQFVLILTRGLAKDESP